MRNKFLRLAVATALVSVTICGCQKAPESSSDGNILHAKGSAENEVEAIVNDSGGDTENNMQEINCTIGTEDNAIRIQAQMPKIPQNVYQMVLTENDTLTKELLKEFLGSDEDSVNDLSEEAQREEEQLKAENMQDEERANYSVFGTAPIYKMSDGHKTASFSYGTSAYYRDERLYEKCAAVYKTAGEKTLEETENTDVYRKSRELLLAKISQIGVTDIDIYKITQYESENITFYEVEFTTAYDGMGLVHEIGSSAYGEIFPLGQAWICEENIARLSLDYGLGKVEIKEECNTLLSWGQIEKILETYLNSGRIIGSDNNTVLTNVEFLYYPLFDEDEDKLELVPVWHIYTPLSKLVENEELGEAFWENDSTWSICVNAVSGELVRSE
jgi:hypothetical protein